ncbi:YncE family protein [Tepidamorphus sp. 3E244]|uniref:YncE family protein n=1 Tax=Tepidamorphus sp. 3E244 TaxID=3385498 RepID=UPI0038FBF241
MDGFSARIDPEITAEVATMLAQLGRTEDVCFSPSNTVMAVAGYLKNSMCLFDVAFDLSGDTPRIRINGWTDIRSDALNEPHGMAFIGETKLVVANRKGKVTVFDTARAGFSGDVLNIDPLRVIDRANAFHHVKTPGSVCVARQTEREAEILVCNNFLHHVTRHRFPLRGGPALPRNAIVLDKHLDIPDGIATDPDLRRVAISNHGTQEVLLFDAARLNATADPVGRLKETGYAHGLRFFDGGRQLCVADAGAPLIRFYRSDDRAWCGEILPERVVRVLDDETFLRGRDNEAEGGPKGIALDATETVLVTTCEKQPLAFFHLSALLAGAPDTGNS